jgi:hypothetical protein
MSTRRVERSENPLVAPAIFLALVLFGVLVITAWSAIPTIATITLWCLFGMGVVAGLLGIALLFVRVRNEWIEGNKLKRGEARLVGGKLVQPMDKAPLSQVTHYTDNRRVETGSLVASGNDTALLDAPTTRPLPDKVNLLAALSQHRPDANNLELYFGEGENGPIIKPFGEETLHIGNVGATGSGKSVQSQSLLFQLALHDPSARRVKFGFVDFEGKTSKPFALAPHTEFIADDPEVARIALAGLIEEMDRRAKMSDSELSGLPIYAVMLEEFLDLKESLPKMEWENLKRLAIRGRKSKIFLMLASQALYSDEDTRVLRGQIRTRNAFAFEDAGTARAFGITDTKALARLMANPRPGRFLQRTPGGLIIAQAPFISAAEITQHFAKAKYYGRPVEISKGETRTSATAEKWEAPIINTTYRVLPEPKPAPRPPKSGTTIHDVLQAYKRGITTAGTLAKEVGCSKTTAYNCVLELRERGLI